MAQGHTKKDFLQANKRHRFLYLNPWNCPGTNHRQSKTLNSGNHSVLPLQLHVSTQCQRGIITTSQKYRGNHLSQLCMSAVGAPKKYVQHLKCWITIAQFYNVCVTPLFAHSWQTVEKDKGAIMKCTLLRTIFNRSNKNENKSDSEIEEGHCSYNSLCVFRACRCMSHADYILHCTYWILNVF
jgi:hypothetical protein